LQAESTENCSERCSLQFSFLAKINLEEQLWLNLESLIAVYVIEHLMIWNKGSV